MWKLVERRRWFSIARIPECKTFLAPLEDDGVLVHFGFDNIIDDQNARIKTNFEGPLPCVPYTLP